MQLTGEIRGVFALADVPAFIDAAPGEAWEIVRIDGRLCARSRQMEGSVALLHGHLIDVNRASLRDLRQLPAVGPARAARITAARPFRTLSEMSRVRGIGVKTIAGLDGWATTRSRRARSDVCEPG